MKCVLLDDEIPGLTYLKMLCEQIRDVEVVKSYDDPQKFLEEAPELDFELCILDIEMPKLNGVQVASMLKEKQIIFTTAYRNYAADAFDLDAIDFVQKPVTKERLEIAIRKAITRSMTAAKSPGYLQLNTDQGKSVIRIENIAFIIASEIDSRDKVAVMHDRSSLVLKNISFMTLREMLPGELFCQVNKRQMISLRIVASFTFEEIITTHTDHGGPLKFVLSEAYRQQFQQLIKKVL